MAGGGDGRVESGQAPSREPKRSCGPRAQSYTPFCIPGQHPLRPAGSASLHFRSLAQRAGVRLRARLSRRKWYRRSSVGGGPGSAASAGRRGGAERRRRRREQSCSAVRGDARSRRAELDGAPRRSCSPLPAAVLLARLRTQLSSGWRHRAASSAGSPEARGAPPQPHE